MFLVDMTIEDSDVPMSLQQGDRSVSVLGRPIPRRIQREQGAMGEDDNGLFYIQLVQIGPQPGELILSDRCTWIRDVVQDDEMNALVVESVVELPEELLVRRAGIERRVVLTRHKSQGLDTEPLDDLAELAESLSPLIAIVGGMREVAREHDEVGLPLKRVHQGNGVLSRHVRLRVWRAFEPP